MANRATTLPNRLTPLRCACLAGALGATLLFSALAVAPAQAMTTEFTFTGGEQTFTVPAGVTSLEIVAIGGYGGDTPLVAGAAHGGNPAEVTGIVNVTPGQPLYVVVGGNGKDADVSSGAGGFNGGGSGGGGSGGGGASDVRTLPLASELEPTDSRLIVAAGGGGAGGVGEGSPGDGGDAEAAGESSEGGWEGGGAGTQTKGGPGGSGCLAGYNGEGGVLGSGGAGGNGGGGPPGGGGGGGLYGGGGGGGACTTNGGGGGGGSNRIPAGGAAKTLTECCIAPKVRIIVAPVISIASPGGGASYTQGQVVNASYSCTPPEGATVKTCAGPVASGAPIDTSTPGSHSFTVNTEDQEGAKGSKTVTYTVAPKAGSPQTKLGSHPKKTIKTKKKKVKVKFTFSSSVPGSTFKCKLDKGQFASCKSPKTYKVKPGKHTFKVAASSGGAADTTPATFSFKVKKTK
jgi:hypothetical protein